MVEHILGKNEVMGSIPIVGSYICIFLLQLLGALHILYVMSDKKDSLRDNKLHEILLSAFDKGYSKSEISGALNDVEQEFEVKASHPGIFSKRITAAQLMLFIGGIITVLGGIFLVAINWAEWNSFGRILALFIPFFMVLSIAIMLRKENKNTQSSTAFAVTSSLLFPLLLLVFFSETELLSLLSASLEGFIYAVLSTIYFAAMAYFFRSTVWSFLYAISTFVSYLFLFDYFDVEPFGPNSIYWGALILALLFFGFCYGLFKKGLVQYGRYALVVSFIVTIVSLILMLSTYPVTSLATWYLIIPAAIYFFTAAFAETESDEDLAKVLYFLGSATLFLMLVKLSFGGKLINLISDSSEFSYSIWGLSDEFAVGGSFALSGLIFLGFAVIAQYIKRFGFTILSTFLKYIEFLGLLGALGGIFIAGLGDKKVLLEFLLGGSSLLAIFFSTVRQSKIYLYTGTVFLIIFIFDLGFEYFNDTLGWPITLLVSGIISMGIGYFMGKIQKKFNAKNSME